MITDEGVLDMIIDATRPNKDDSVLDVACGPGIVVCAFAPYVRKAIGIDFTPAMLDQARKRAADKGLRNVGWNQGDAYSLPYLNGSFSIVVTRYSLHHLEQPEKALQEMMRVCAPGGRLVVIDAYAPEDTAKAAAYHRVEKLRDPSHARALSLSELRGLFTHAGLVANERVYQLTVELNDLLARAFPDPADLAEIAATFTAAASDNRLGIPVRRDDDKVHIDYQVVLLVAERPAKRQPIHK
jgi:SAM-dependent methyltransferase